MTEENLEELRDDLNLKPGEVKIKTNVMKTNVEAILPASSTTNAVMYVVNRIRTNLGKNCVSSPAIYSDPDLLSTNPKVRQAAEEKKKKEEKTKQD